MTPDLCGDERSAGDDLKVLKNYDLKSSCDVMESSTCVSDVNCKYAFVGDRDGRFVSNSHTNLCNNVGQFTENCDVLEPSTCIFNGVKGNELSLGISNCNWKKCAKSSKLCEPSECEADSKKNTIDNIEVSNICSEPKLPNPVLQRTKKMFDPEELFTGNYRDQSLDYSTFIFSPTRDFIEKYKAKDTSESTKRPNVPEPTVRNLGEQTKTAIENIERSNNILEILSHIDSNGNDCENSNVKTISSYNPKPNLETEVTTNPSVDLPHISNYYVSGNNIVKYSDHSLNTILSGSSSSNSQDYIDKYLDTDTSSTESSDEVMTSLESGARTVIYESASSREVGSMNVDEAKYSKNDAKKSKTSCVLS